MYDLFIFTSKNNALCIKKKVQVVLNCLLSIYQTQEWLMRWFVLINRMLTDCKNDYKMQQIYSRGIPPFHRRLKTFCI